MDEQAQRMLDAVLVKEPGELSETDKALLRARVHYVGKKSREKFASVLAEQPQVPSQGQSEEAEEEKKSDPLSHPAEIPEIETADQDSDDEDDEE